MIRTRRIRRRRLNLIKARFSHLLTSRRPHWPQNIRRTPLAADKINLPENIHQPTDHRVLLTGKRTPLATHWTDLAGKIFHLAVPGTDFTANMTNLADQRSVLAIHRTDLAAGRTYLAGDWTSTTRNNRLLALKEPLRRETVPEGMLPNPAPVRTIPTSPLINPYLLPSQSRFPCRLFGLS